MTEHVQTYAQSPTHLRLHTFKPTSLTFAPTRSELVPAMDLELEDDKLVRITCLDAAYEPMAAELATDGIWSQALMRVVKPDTDGLTFLLALANMLVNSSYWHAEWVRHD